MESMIATKLKEMELFELISLLTKLKMEDIDSFRKLKEIVDDA